MLIKHILFILLENNLSLDLDTSVTHCFVCYRNTRTSVDKMLRNMRPTESRNRRELVAERIVDENEAWKKKKKRLKKVIKRNRGQKFSFLEVGREEVESIKTWNSFDERISDEWTAESYAFIAPIWRCITSLKNSSVCSCAEWRKLEKFSVSKFPKFDIWNDLTIWSDRQIHKLVLVLLNQIKP